MNQSLQVWSIFVMGGITLLLRALPLIFAKQLAHRTWLSRLNQYLPLCVMVILTCVSIDIPHKTPTQISYEAIALLVAAASYIWQRNTLLSVALGILTLSLLSY